MCMVFGPGIPIMFPIGLLCLSINYLVDRYSIAKFYRQPPRFRNVLIAGTLSDLMFSPIVYSAFGFWMYGNR